MHSPADDEPKRCDICGVPATCLGSEQVAGQSDKTKPGLACNEHCTHDDTGCHKLESVVGIAVIRKGMHIFVGDPEGRGMWIECDSAHASRRAKALFEERLKAGYDGEVHELILEVGKKVTAEVDLYRAEQGRKRRVRKQR